MKKKRNEIFRMLDEMSEIRKKEKKSENKEKY